MIAFTITSGLSGSYGVACAAKESCEERDPSRRIQVFDSLSAGPEIALLIEKAAAELRAGTNFDTVCNVLKSYQSQTHLLFALESMHNLAQNGESASWRQRWQAFLESALWDRPSARGYA